MHAGARAVVLCGVAGVLFGCGAGEGGADLPESAPPLVSSVWNGDDEVELFAESADPGPSLSALRAQSDVLDDGVALADPRLVPALPNGPRRGPISFTFTATDPQGNATGVSLERSSGGVFVPATVQTRARTGRVYTLVWRSFADVQTDATVRLRATLRDPDGDVPITFDVAVRNAGDADRIVLTGHPLVLVDGGVTRTGRVVRAVTLGSSGQATGSDARLSVGRGPDRFRFAPHGRAAVVLEAADGTVSVLSTPLSGRAADVTVLHRLSLPYGFAFEAQWSSDGRFLFVTGSEGGGRQATLWRYRPSEDLSTFGAPQALRFLPGPPMRFDVDRQSGNLFIYCAAGTSDADTLLLVDYAGRELDSERGDFGVPSALALSPDGRRALLLDITRGFVLEVRFSAAGFRVVPELVTDIANPFDAVFRPGVSGDAVGLVSNLDGDSVTPFAISANGAFRSGPALKGFPLAAELAVVERGALAGRVLVVGAADLRAVELSLDGTASAQGVVQRFGDAIEDTPLGVGVQR